MKFPIKDFFSKFDQIRSFLRNWSHLLKKSLMESFIFCAVFVSYDYWARHSVLILYTICLFRGAYEYSITSALKS